MKYLLMQEIKLFLQQMSETNKDANKVSYLKINIRKFLLLQY